MPTAEVTELHVSVVGVLQMDVLSSLGKGEWRDLALQAGAVSGMAPLQAASQLASHFLFSLFLRIWSSFDITVQ